MLLNENNSKTEYKERKLRRLGLIRFNYWFIAKNRIKLINFFCFYNKKRRNLLNEEINLWLRVHTGAIKLALE